MGREGRLERVNRSLAHHDMMKIYGGGGREKLDPELGYLSILLLQRADSILLHLPFFI